MNRFLDLDVLSQLATKQGNPKVVARLEQEKNIAMQSQLSLPDCLVISGKKKVNIGLLYRIGWNI